MSFIDHRGRVKKLYPYKQVTAHYEQLSNVPGAVGYLCRGVTFEELGTIAKQMSDRQFAEGMVDTRFKLFQ
jgi:hypothetical protein